MSGGAPDIRTFQAERPALNQLVFRYAGRNMKRFWALDNQAYEGDTALSAKTKELLGLVASLVLRCDDCIYYHTGQCFEAGVTSAEYEEALNIGLLVGGSIVIPHLRRAFKAWEDLGGQPPVEGSAAASEGR
jgi:AhpD family alkylhydroperoxidase